MNKLINEIKGHQCVACQTWHVSIGHCQITENKIIVNGKEVEKVFFEYTDIDPVGRKEIMKKIDLPATLQAAGAEVGDTVRIIADQEYRFCLTPDGLQKWTVSLSKKYTDYAERVPTVYVNAVGHGKRQ